MTTEITFPIVGFLVIEIINKNEIITNTVQNIFPINIFFFLSKSFLFITNNDQRLDTSVNMPSNFPTYLDFSINLSLVFKFMTILGKETKQFQKNKDMMKSNLKCLFIFYDYQLWRHLLFQNHFHLLIF